MQPQPTIPTPAPPPPLPLSLSAFTQAASTASRYALTFRNPTLQLAVLPGSPQRLLPHAHIILRSLAAKGVHGFLQTEFEHPVTDVCTAIIPELLPDVVAISRADFFVLVADHNVQNRTVQLRLPPKPDFIEVPIAKLCNIVRDAWTQLLRTVKNIAHLQALASNPNVVTTAHVDSLLHSISNLSSLRRLYAKLARLANITQDWQSVPAPKPILSHQPQPPTQPQPTKQQLQPLSTPLLSDTPSVPSSVASTWIYADRSHSSSTPSGELPTTTNTALVSTNQLTPQENDLGEPASSRTGGKPEAHSPTLISTQSSAMAHLQHHVLQPFETQQRHPMRSTTTSNPTQSTKQTLDSASESATDLNEAQNPELTTRSEQSPSHKSADPRELHGVPSSANHADVSSHDPDHSVAKAHPMTATALRRSLTSIDRANTRNQYSDRIRASQPEFSFSWLKRSQHLSAKILRHQYLASHLHRTLLEACDSIAKMQTSTRPTAYHEPNSLPTEAHRQWLLREIHYLIPRIEELGK
ncbi:hypothetical protein FGB62_339g010 [Gracilaria domingensis]|nr:hypothetical protein FGB62_339g010 [Gracilaria domingensis]